MPDHLQECTEESPSPCAGALVAATMTLMTIWADPAPDGGAGQGLQRPQIAGKIAANLHLLSRHPQLDDPLRRVMARAHARWAGLAPAVAWAAPPQASAPGPVRQ